MSEAKESPPLYRPFYFCVNTTPAWRNLGIR